MAEETNMFDKIWKRLNTPIFVPYPFYRKVVGASFVVAIVLGLVGFALSKGQNGLEFLAGLLIHFPLILMMSHALKGFKSISASRIFAGFSGLVLVIASLTSMMFVYESIDKSLSWGQLMTVTFLLLLIDLCILMVFHVTLVQSGKLSDWLVQIPDGLFKTVVYVGGASGVIMLLQQLPIYFVTWSAVLTSVVVSLTAIYIVTILVANHEISGNNLSNAQAVILGCCFGISIVEALFFSALHAEEIFKMFGLYTLIFSTASSGIALLSWVIHTQTKFLVLSPLPMFKVLEPVAHKAAVGIVRLEQFSWKYHTYKYVGMDMTLTWPVSGIVFGVIAFALYQTPLWQMVVLIVAIGISGSWAYFAKTMRDIELRTNNERKHPLWFRTKKALAVYEKVTIWFFAILGAIIVGNIFIDSIAFAVLVFLALYWHQFGDKDKLDTIQSS